MKKMRRLGPIPRDLAIEVLTLLPAKSLMRFKCVSKLWCSTITDPLFVKLHRSRSLTRQNGSGLLICSPNRTFSEQRFFYANLQGYSRRHELTLPISHYDSLTQVINALVCFSYGNRVLVCNVSTHQVLTLPVTSFNVNNTHVNVPNYYFGFDSVNEEYKLLNMCTFRTCSPDGSSKKISSLVEWEILTLGADSWRKIDAPPFKFHNPSVFIYGFIYWLHRIDELLRVVVAFDVKDEQFHIIPVPQNASLNGQPVQIGERLALANATECIHNQDPNNPLELWILTDRHNHTWIKTCIRFPLAVMRHPYRCVLPAANIPTGEVLFTPLKLSLPLPVVYYDAKTGDWITIEIDDLPVSEDLFGERPPGMVCITPYVENILPLPNLS